jgi:dienelactone hydrolase
MARWVGLVGCILWATGTVAARIATHGGVDSAPVEFHLADGSAIHGVLYRGCSTDPSADPRAAPAAVVLHGTALTHSSCAPGLSVPLARIGFAVLAIDLRGHGRSEGSLPRSEYARVASMLASSSDQPEVEAAIEFLRTRPGVDGRHPVLVGVSRGGCMAATVAVSRDDVACAISVSSAPTNCDTQRPRNLLFLVGGMDQCIPRAQYEAAFDRATADAGTPGAPFGDFARGTARQMFVSPWNSHLSVLADSSSTRRAVQWAAWSVGRDPGAVPGDPLYLAAAAVALASLGGLLTLCGAVTVLAARLLPTGAETPPGRTTLAVAAVVLLPVLVSPLANRVGDHLPDGGVLFASHAFAQLFVLGLFALLAGGLASRSQSTAAPTARGLWRAVILGLSTAGCGLAIFGATWGTTWLDLMPTPGRVRVAVVLAVLFLPCCLALASGVQRALGKVAPTRAGAILRGLVWIGMALTLWLGHVCFGRVDHPFQGIPLLFIVLSSFVPLPLWLLSDRPGLGTARAVGHAVTAACFLAWHLPFVHSG